MMGPPILGWAAATAVLVLAPATAFAAPPPPDPSPVVAPDPTPPPDVAAAPSGVVSQTAPGAPLSAPSQGSYAIPVAGRGRARQPAASPPPPPPPTPAPAVVPAAAAAEAGEPPVVARAEQCLRANARRVVLAEPEAGLAQPLLLIGVCAEEVDAASLYLRNLAALSRYNPLSERGRAGLSTAHVDEETGELVNPPDVDATSGLTAGPFDPGAAAPAAARLRRLSAELVLEEAARLRPAPPQSPPKEAQKKPR